MKYEFLEIHRPLPAIHPENKVVHWRVFREVAEAEEHAVHIQLAEGQTVVGGFDSDSVGRLWWVGVEVDDVARWGNLAAVNKHAQ